VAQPIPIERPEVTVIDGTLVVHELEERDPEVVGLIDEADDAVEATRQCLRIGVRAVRVARVSVDSDLVEKRFEAMESRLTVKVDEAVAGITGAAHDLLDEDGGALVAALAGHEQQIEEILGATFDPDSKKSVIALVEQVLAEAHEHHTKAIQRLVSADGDDSPLAKIKHEIIAHVKAHLGELRSDIREVSEKIAVAEAVAPIIDLTTGKGFTYEDVVHECTGRIAAPHGDVAEKTGKTAGVAGNQKGDEVVTLNRDDAHGLETCFVLEAKAKKLNMRETVEELDDAMENRDALAAIAVFSTQAQAPTSLPFQYTDTKAIAVLDKEGADDAALRLAYMWARWVVRRQLAGSAAEELDLARIGRLIDDARRAIERAATVKSCHTRAKNAIEQAGEQVRSLVNEVEQALDALAEELAEAAEEE
jgi:hypothetical protein